MFRVRRVIVLAAVVAGLIGLVVRVDGKRASNAAPGVSFYDRTGEVDLVEGPLAGRLGAAPFLRQARREVRRLLCPDRSECAQVDRRTLRVLTTLDTRAQQVGLRWLRSALREEPSGDPDAASPDWLEEVRGEGVHNGATAVLDYRTGDVLAYVGSADPDATDSSPGFQPQFDALADGWRQPGSAVKPFNYLLGIDERKFTAATLFMDVVTDFTGQGFVPAQADGLERGPVRARQALQFSLNVPAVKASYRNGLDRLFEETVEWGFSYRAAAEAVPSMALGTLETRPIDLLSAYGALANGGVLVPRRYVREIRDDRGRVLWPSTGPAPGRRVSGEAAAFIVAHILSENTDPTRNPLWGQWRIEDGDARRPAAYKTGTTDRNVDLHAYGFVAPPIDTSAPALAAGVWLGNSDGSRTGELEALEAAAPIWSAILGELTAGTPIAEFQPPAGITRVCVDVHSGLLPGPHTTDCVPEYFLDGTAPTQEDDTKYTVEVDAATGARWVDGCVGPPVENVFLDLERIEADVPAWHRTNRGWIRRAAGGVGRVGGVRATRTAYLYDRNGTPDEGATWGAPFAPWFTCDQLSAAVPAQP